MTHDDDIKIFKGERNLPQEPIPPETEETSRTRLDAARAIGATLAECTKQAERGFELQIEDDFLLQRRFLLCFAIATGLEDCAASKQVARTALNSFYDTLKRSDPGFYDDIGSSGAFSFYYLAKRQNREIERRIGQTFAMLCGHDGDPVCQELGEALYCRYLNMVEEQLRHYQLNK